MSDDCNRQFVDDLVEGLGLTEAQKAAIADRLGDQLDLAVERYLDARIKEWIELIERSVRRRLS